MKALMKHQFYLMTLFVSVLLTVGTVTSDDQTNLSTEDVMQTTKKSTVMILGTYHMANPGADAANFEADDVLAPKKQREIQQLVEQLARFNPTKVAVELDTSLDAKLEARYQDYLNGRYQLERDEFYQVSFRLAKKMQHPKVYCVDWFGRTNEEENTVDLEDFAKTHNQSVLLVKAGTVVQNMVQETLVPLGELQESGSVIDMYHFLNQEKTIRVMHEINNVPALICAQIGVADQYVGVDALLRWYERNLKIFVNLTRITESSDDRILLIIGAGHVGLLQQFLEDSGDYIVESPLKYLKTENAN